VALSHIFWKEGEPAVAVPSAAIKREASTDSKPLNSWFTKKEEKKPTGSFDILAQIDNLESAYRQKKDVNQQRTKMMDPEYQGRKKVGSIHRSSEKSILH
jgi:hypothetical protein